MTTIDASISAAANGRSKVQTRLGRVDCVVVIVTYNSVRDIVSLLESLPAAGAGMTLRTIVVDNGSTDGTIELVRGRADVRFVETGANLGYAAAINIGREEAGEFSSLMVLNPDVVLEVGALREMFTGLSDPAVGMVAPMLLDADGCCSPSLRREPTVTRAIGDGLLGRRLGRRPSWLSEIVRDESAYLHRHAVDWATGAALLISASCDCVVGRWDERFFLYSEETDYAARARVAGFRVEYLPTAIVRHRGGGSGQSNTLIALKAVSRIRYMEKYGRRPGAFRAAVTLHEALRLASPSHRTALRTVVRRSRWSALPALLQVPTVGIAPDRRPLNRKCTDSPKEEVQLWPGLR